jgi:Ion channel
MKSTLSNLQQRLRDPTMTALLVLEISIIFVMSPLRAMGMAPHPMVLITIVLLIMIAVVTLSRSRGAVVLILVSIALNLAGTLIHFVDPTSPTLVLRTAGELVARGVLGWVVAEAVFAPGRINHYRVQGAIVLYLNFAMMFGALYRLLAEIYPNAFRGLTGGTHDPGFVDTMTYFSFSVLTSASFGDIFPLHPLARCLANLEAVIGQLYPATLLARIVTLELEHRRDRNGQAHRRLGRAGAPPGDTAGNENWMARHRESSRVEDPRVPACEDAL